jgi:hypothetical protein
MVLGLADPGVAVAAEEACVNPDTDLLVWVGQSSIQLPGVDSLYETSRVSFESGEMELNLMDLGVEAIGIGLPEMLGSSSTGMRTDGVVVQLTDYSNVFRFISLWIASTSSNLTSTAKNWR